RRRRAVAGRHLAAGPAGAATGGRADAGPRGAAPGRDPLSRRRRRSPHGARRPAHALRGAGCARAGAAQPAAGRGEPLQGARRRLERCGCQRSPGRREDAERLRAPTSETRGTSLNARCHGVDVKTEAPGKALLPARDGAKTTAWVAHFRVLDLHDIGAQPAEDGPASNWVKSTIVTPCKKVKSQ